MSHPDLIGQVGEIDSLVAFFPDVPGQHREAIQDLLLYAQLRASHLHDFNSGWNSWIHNYRQHLEGQGFRSRGLVTGDSLVIGSPDDLDAARFRIANAQVREHLAGLVRDSFWRLGVSQVAAGFFQGRYLSSARLGSFQLMPCVMADSGEVMALLCSLRLNVDEFAAGGKRLILHFKGGAYLFEPERFARHHEAVRRYLSGKAGAFITRVRL